MVRNGNAGVVSKLFFLLTFYFFPSWNRHYLFYLIHCQLLAEEQPDDINAYERYVLTNFLAGDISWMPLGKAITMGSGKEPDPSEDIHVGNNLLTMNETVQTMKNDLIDLQENLGTQMNEVKDQIQLLLSKMDAKSKF